MSELKTYNSERIYWAVEQVEQEAGDIEDLHLDDNLFYIKSEADKVVAELKDKCRHYPMMAALIENYAKEIAEMKKCCKDKDDFCQHTLKENRHHKSKRCLTVARWCRRNRLHTCVCGPVEKIDFWEKWRKRWLELAEKFKEAKFPK
jgi:hypothetical protein